MNVGRLDHTAVAVHDLDEAIERYMRLFHLELVDRQVAPDGTVEAAFLRIGDSMLELISPILNDSGVGRFLERRGEGLHHIAFAVDDISGALLSLEQDGVELIDRTPRAGVHGQIAFLRPQSMRGVLVELVMH